MPSNLSVLRPRFLRNDGPLLAILILRDLRPARHALASFILGENSCPALWPSTYLPQLYNITLTMDESDIAASSSATWYTPILSSTAQAVSYFRFPLIASTSIAVFLSGVLYFKQTELIYPRNIPLDSRTAIFKPSEFSMPDFEDLTLPTTDGEALHAYLIRPSNHQMKRNVSVLMFHGNAGNIGHRLPIARVLTESLGLTVLMLEYRGYGRSTGKPSERGFVQDAQTGLDYLKERAETSSKKVLVYGQSIGSAVAIQLVAKNQDAVKGLIVENTFTSMRKLIPE